MSSVASVPSVQYAALPWRKVHGALQILLITTRTTHRWIVPKGWPVVDISPSEAAATEALEEAGVTGKISEKPLGSFGYDKRLKNGDLLPCKVLVYPLQVTHQRRNWIEKAARQTEWCSPLEALQRVSEPGLRRIIAKFANISGRRPVERQARTAAR